MPGFSIRANAISYDVDAPTRSDAIDAYVRDAGYGSVAEAAEVCGETTARFLDDIVVRER